VRRTLHVTLDGDPPITIAVGAAAAGGCWLAFDDAAAARVTAATCAALLAPLVSGR
jgi:hypothetical protein